MENKKKVKVTVPLCYICGKAIYEEDHVQIKTKRRTNIHMHTKCFKQQQQENLKRHMSTEVEDGD